jgi:hypothetical protein
MGGLECSAAPGRQPALLVLLGSLAFVCGCPAPAAPVVELAPLDDGACARALGTSRELWSGPTLGVASDGAQTFLVDGSDGHLRVRSGDAPPALLAPKLVVAPDRVRWGWLLADRAHVYWVPGHVESVRGNELQLTRVSRQGGAVQPGFQPSGPVISVHIDEWGGLLLTEAGLWRLDLRAWGQARLLRSGQFSTLAADPRYAYLRPTNELGPMDFVAHQVLDGNLCHEPASSSIVRVDRQTGATTTVFESRDLLLFGPLVADETHLYTAAEPQAETADDKACRVRRLLRIGKESGSVNNRRVPAGIGGDLIGHGGHLYWIDGVGRVFRTPKAGGPVTVVAEVPCRPNRLAAAGSSIAIWKADGGQCAPVAVPANQELATAVTNLESGDALLAVSGGWAYLANAEDRLRRVSLGKGTSEPIKARNGAPVTAIQAAVIGEALFFLGPDFLGRWSPATGEVTRLYEGHARALAPDGDELYLATEDGSIAVLGKTGGPRTLSTGRGSSVRDLAALHRAVYWIEGAASNRGSGRALWTARPDGQRTQLLSTEGMDQIATDGRAIYYATEGRSRLLPGERELPGTIMRFLDGQPSKLADRQETVTDLRASRRGVFWRQRRGVRWIDEAGALRALDCTVADQGVGLVESDGAVYWADATARAVMMTRLGR